MCDGDFIDFKGRRYFVGDSLYYKSSPKYIRGGLKGLSRTIKAVTNDVAVVVKIDEKKYERIQTDNLRKKA